MTYINVTDRMYFAMDVMLHSIPDLYVYRDLHFSLLNTLCHSADLKIHCAAHPERACFIAETCETVLT